MVVYTLNALMYNHVRSLRSHAEEAVIIISSPESGLFDMEFNTTENNLQTAGLIFFSLELKQEPRRFIYVKGPRLWTSDFDGAYTHHHKKCVAVGPYVWFCTRNPLIDDAIYQ